MKSSPGPRTFDNTTCSTTALLLTQALLLCLVVAGCRSTGRSTPIDERDTAAPVTAVRPVQAVQPAAPKFEPAPAWLTEPLSHEKLKRIETWLVTDGPQASPEWRIEGELVLNLGRLEFARKEAQEKGGDVASAADSSGAAGVGGLQSRLLTARAGLERVTSELDATAAQRKRALDGLARANRLINGPSKAERGTTNAGALKGLDLTLVPRSAWGAMPARVDRMEKNRAPYTRITVHHSADREPPHLDGSLAASEAEMRQIQKAHLDGKDTHYGDIGYHFVIDPSGRVLEGRELAYQGAHAYGDNNVQNLGICLIGNFDLEQPTKAALDALKRVLDHLRKTYNISKTRVYGHRELRKTECPGDNLMHWLDAYRR